MKRGVFITGTDTGVGKTLVSAMLASSLARNGYQPGYFKPVQTGADDDTGTAADLAKLPPERTAQPVYRFNMPAAPNRAASAENREIRIGDISDRWRSLNEGTWIVEGAGGLLVPLTPKETIRELVNALALPLLLVSSTRLGTINHTLLTLEAAATAGLQVAGIVLTGEKDPGLAETLKECSGVPVLAEIPVLSPITAGTVAAAAEKHFPAAVLEKIFGSAS